MELINSFILYGSVFSVSCFLIWLGQKGQKQLVPSWILFLTALLIPSIIAGLRSDDVGGDIWVYIAPTYYETANFNSLDEMEINLLSVGIYRVGSIEVGFVYLAYFANKFLGHLGFFFGLITFTQSLFVFLALYHYRKKVQIWHGMLFFYCWYFIYFGFNSVRQGLAASICFFAMIFLFEKKLFKYFIFVSAAILFHRTAVLFFIFPILFWYAENFIKLKHTIIFMLVIIVSMIIVFSQIQSFLEVLELAEKYDAYLNPNRDDRAFKWLSMIVYIPLVIAIFVKKDFLFSKLREFNFLIYIFIFAIFTPCLMVFGNVLMRRIGEYFFLPLCLIFAMSLSKIKMRHISNLYFNLCGIFYCYSKLFIVIHGYGDEVLFRSKLLNSVM